MSDGMVSFVVKGKRALFADPLTKAGGEKFSYPVPSYQALKGICDNIYWKPTFKWVIDSVKVINKIRYRASAIKPMHYQNSGNDLSIYTYLADVEYEVVAHLIWNDFRSDLESDRDLKKHVGMFNLCLDRGGNFDVFLGTRECTAEVLPLEGSKKSYYEGVTKDYGFMYHSLSYPEEREERTIRVFFWDASMSDGVITFPEQSDCGFFRTLREN